GAELAGLRLQLAVLGLLLPGAGRRVIRQQQLDERAPGLLHLVGFRLHMDARARVWLELARAGSRHDSLAAELSVALDPHVDAADPAHAGRGLGRQVAHRWDGDPELLGGVEDRGVARYAYHLAVDRDLYQLVTHAEPPTPA